MTSSIKTIFLAENEKDIFSSLKDQGIDTKVFENKLANLLNRVYNNFVGYYIFRQDNFVYKLIILPKTIGKDSKTKEKDFVNYLLHYYRVNSKHSFDTTRTIEDSLLSLAFEKNNEKENSHLPLEEFEFYKHQSILQDIEAFFTRHKNYKRVNVDYLSQSVKYKLNLQKNIKELDKTKIHQTQVKDLMYSKIATITYNALKIFMTQRLKALEYKEKEKLIYQTKKINAFISKKYSIDKNYKLTLSKLNSLRVAKTFNDTKETKTLLVGIKSLFGFEQMYHDDEMSVENRYDLNTSSFFIDPILFYEWYIYDILKNYADGKNKTILFDKIDSETTTQYQIDSQVKPIKKSSQPDYILIDEDKKVKAIIDAKWKNIVSGEKIESNDYLKLQFDTSLLVKDNYVTVSYLVYPNLYSNSDSLNVKVGNESIFGFNILEINMNFEKDKNSLDFDYDDKILSDKIEEIEKIEALKAISTHESNKINSYRAETISKLINQINLEENEELLNELDNQLIHSANQLSEQLEEQVLLPEISEIIEIYSDILEKESIKFLKSSSFIYSYYRTKKYKHFDYSMPGSGLWKLVELELNTSFVWYVRIINNVCNTSCPWTPIGYKKTAITHEISRHKKVRLNQFEHNNKNKLQGVTLGGINLLMNDKDIIEEFNELFIKNPGHKVFLTNELPSTIKNISNLRNEHAHIKAMSLVKFEELYSILFSNSDKRFNTIKKLLNFKKYMMDYYKLSYTNIKQNKVGR